ncbi:hypothetical protein ATER59S_01675 [Aquamicrobium terrae]
MMMPWEDAIVAVLAEEGGAMHYGDIAERVLAKGLRQPVPNPSASVAGTISTSLRSGDSPFQKVGRGQYILRDHSAPRLDPSPALPEVVEDESESEAGAIRAFGMYWRREAVQWSRAKPQLLGRQNQNAEPVDFAGQVGVYLLHDRDRTIYVGRAADALHTRLRAHTGDRLGGRWDRFSWFGLRGVDPDGDLSAPSAAWSHEMVIETLEALLIESMEPPLNRKRGDRFSAVEYLQADDPGIEKARKAQFVQELVRAVGVSA